MKKGILFTFSMAYYCQEKGNIFLHQNIFVKGKYILLCMGTQSKGESISYIT